MRDTKGSEKGQNQRGRSTKSVESKKKGEPEMKKQSTVGGGNRSLWVRK